MLVIFKRRAHRVIMMTVMRHAHDMITTGLCSVVLKTPSDYGRVPLGRTGTLGQWLAVLISCVPRARSSFNPEFARIDVECVLAGGLLLVIGLVHIAITIERGTTVMATV